MIRALNIIFFVAVLSYGVDLTDKDLTEDTANAGVWRYENTTDADIIISSELGSHTQDQPNIENITKLELSASATNATITLDGSTNKASLGIGANGHYAFDISASMLTLTGKADDKSAAQIQVFAPSKIQANTTLNNARVSFASSNPTREPTLSIEGDFSATNSLIEHYETSLNGINSSFVVSGTSTIQNTEFSIITSTSRASKPILRYVVMSSAGGYNADVLTSNKAFMKVSKSVSMLEQQYSVSILSPNSQYANIYKEGKDTLFSTSLKREGNELIIERSLGNATFKDIEEENVKMDIEIIKEFLNNVITTGNERIKLGNLLSFLEMRQNFLAANTQTDAEFLAQYNDKDSPAGDIVLSALNAHQNIKDYIGLSLANDALYNKAQGVIKEVVDNARSSIEVAKTTSSTASAINVSNDMAIGTRIAAAYNPYAHLASLKDKYFVALGNDPRLYYTTSPYANGVWTNAFGGASIIESKGGGLFGISVGYDQKNFDSALLGVYFSYANAVIKDGSVEQESNNYQLGFYSSFNPFYGIEMNFKLYGQLATTRQTSYNSLFDEMSADFTRHFVGTSLSVGRIFGFDNDTFYLKPFIGINYSYAYTPSYIEKGNAAQEVKSITDHAASAEFGADLRQYISENSFVYITPKIEQYFVESGDDYVAGFLGSNTNFVVKANHYKKTYAQIILGGNFDLGEHFNITLGLGAKQAIQCACESKSESYLSGNLGLRYKY